GNGGAKLISADPLRADITRKILLFWAIVDQKGKMRMVKKIFGNLLLQMGELCKFFLFFRRGWKIQSAKK
ncbi:hypothetical protein NE606_18760, partial [Agathobaculum butyriciproducens]|nr:hypothetical protein [Agathobaculum butyriciproducens]